ncbi:DUF1097 domain-containing protein [Lentzea sp. NPDC051838]|uniref:DUF1097 domain-containing protein n=1 Tax=Lentzea sp. NPDC051838 TaxID=3154849 RepID=UPI00341CE436
MSTATVTQAPIRLTVAAAGIAAVASLVVTLAGLPVWALFVGWVAWLLRPASVAQGLRSMACAAAGLLLAIAAQASIGLLAPVVGPLAIALTVFAVGVIVVGLRTHDVFGNPSAWFLGLVSSFALHADNAVDGLVTLVPAMAVGAVAGFVGQRVNHLRIIGGS